MGKWLPEALKFVEINSEALQKRPVAYFVVCAAMKDDTEANRKKADAFSDPARTVVKPVDTGNFAGVVDFSKMNFFTRFMMKNMMKAPEGDFRDEDAIRAWAKQLYTRLTGERSGS